MIRRSSLALFAAFVLASTPAFAHPRGYDVYGFMSGLMHPFSGADHVLAMVAVGLWAGLIGGRAMLIWPAAFVVAIVAGSVAGMLGAQVPMTEALIGISVVVLGLMVAFGARASLAVGAALCSAFALFHGVAHGAEMPENASGIACAIGFGLGTLVLHAVGVLSAVMMKSYARIVGAAVTIAGTALLFS